MDMDMDMDTNNNYIKDTLVRVSHIKLNLLHHSLKES